MDGYFEDETARADCALRGAQLKDRSEFGWLWMDTTF
jgi:hypothetical protein